MNKCHTFVEKNLEAETATQVKYYFVKMSDVEVRVSAILEKIVDVSVMEIGKIVGVSDLRRQPEEAACSAETAQKSSPEMVGKTCFFCSRCRWCVDVPTSPACTAEHRNRSASELYSS